MKGHENLINMRLAGKKPQAVWFYLRDYPEFKYHWDSYSGGYAMPEVFVSPDDNIKLLDLRFVVGMTVHVIGWHNDRIKDICEALINAKAKVVYAVVDSKVKVYGVKYEFNNS